MRIGNRQDDNDDDDDSSMNVEDLGVPFGDSENGFSAAQEESLNWLTDEEGDMFASGRWKHADEESLPDLNEESFRFYFSPVPTKKKAKIRLENEVEPPNLIDYEDLEASSKTIRFAPQIATTFGIASLDTYDPFASLASLNTDDVILDSKHSSQRSLTENSEDSFDLFAEEDQTNTIIEAYQRDEEFYDDEGSDMEEDEDDQDARIKRQLMYAVGGIALFKGIGWGFKKIMYAMNKTKDEPPAADAIQTAGDATTQTMQDAATSAAMGGDPTSTTAMVVQANQANTFSASIASGSQSQSAIGLTYVPGTDAAAMGAAQ